MTNNLTVFYRFQALSRYILFIAK